MSLEDAFADLLEVAKHRGELDREAVRKATTVLAWPRYAASLDPAGLLVEDLKHVIDGIADGPADDDAGDDGAEDQAPDKSLHAFARRYFSLEAAGDTLTDRRRLAGDLGGGGRRWMSAGVIYRVLAGLLELQVDEAAAKLVAPPSQASSETLLGSGYRIDSVRVLREVDEHSARYRRRDVLEYELSLFANGRHLLVLPYPFSDVRLMDTHNAHPWEPPGPQLVKLPGENGFVAAVVFGARQEAGERVQIKVEHMPQRRWPSRLRKDRYPYFSSYYVGAPVGNLTLQVRLLSVVRPRYGWEVVKEGAVASDPTIVAELPDSIWSCDNPEVGHVYTLTPAEIRVDIDRT